MKRSLILFLIIFVFSCKKEEQQFYYPIKAKLSLFNSMENYLNCGLSVDFTDRAIIINSSSNWNNSGKERKFFYELNYSETSIGIIKPKILYLNASISDSSYTNIQIIINGQMDQLFIKTNRDYIFADLKSTNKVEFSGPSILNRLKPGTIWGYIQCKDQSFLSFANDFKDSIITSGNIIAEKLLPGPYYYFNISKDSLIDNLIEQQITNLDGIIIPFAFKYNNDFSAIRKIAERFAYLPSDKNALAIYLRDSFGNKILIKYYL
ncbi:MAG: hypothetical protein ACOYMA_13940 [Bacteroidia bacterium]